MMLVIPAAGLLLGAACGYFYPFLLPASYMQYVAVGILAALDTVMGGVNARLQKQFDLRVFFTGFFMNSLFAVLLTCVGSLLNISLYMAAVLVFGMRIFQNFAQMRRYMLNNYPKRYKIE